MAATIYHRHMTQRVLSDPHWRVNCTAYCGAMMAGDATLGGLTITGQQVRALSSEPTPDPASPGLNIPQVLNVLRKLHVVPVVDLTGESWATLIARVNGGRKALVQIDYASLGNLRCQANGDFGHAMLIAGPLRNGSMLASDPLCNAARYYPEEVLRKAATVFAADSGVNGIRFAVTRSIGRYES